jgi:hypothetical protein
MHTQLGVIVVAHWVLLAGTTNFMAARNVSAYAQAADAAHAAAIQQYCLI